MCFITTPRLSIRPFRADDWRDLHGYLSREEAVRFEPYGVFSELDAMREAERRAGDADFLAVELCSESKVIGNLYRTKKDFGEWEIGYVFNPEYWGRGYATEAARALVARLFETEAARRITAKCDPLNERSWKMLERLGFTREGRLRRNVFFKCDARGEPIWKDTYVYGLLKDDENLII